MSINSQIIIQGSEQEVKIKQMKGEIASQSGLLEIFCKIYDSLADNEAFEVKIYRSFILVGKRVKGHGSDYYHKFTNYGLSSGNRTTALSYAIRAVDGGSLKDYCYNAMNGDIEALRLTTKHLVRAYNAKIKRLKEKGRDPRTIEYYEAERDKVEKRLLKDDDEFLELTEPVLIEIPRNPDVFYDNDDNVVSIMGTDDINVED
jgi:hypothetical protein